MKLSIANISIGKDMQGRYSLADLHQASGGAKRHTPSRWLKNQRTKNIIAELETQIRVSNFQAVNVVKGHGITATYVVWQLVYDYAMWVSPAFQIKVIETFHNLQNRPQLQHEKKLAQKYGFYPPLRALALAGKKDSEIAPVLGRSFGSVGYHRNKQFNEGYTAPLEYAHKRYAPNTAAKLIAKRGWNAWGSDYVPPQFELLFA